MTKYKKKKRKSILGILLFIVILTTVYFVLARFVFNGDNTRAKNDNNVTEKEKEKEPEVQIVDVNSKTRPIAVMINNIGAARPYHTGLQNAYLVYEIIVEGGITRYMALFKDNFPEVVGSVRSARHYYLDYALENDAFYAHWGWSPKAESDIESLKINNLNGLTMGSPYFFRKNLGISTEHTGFTNLKALSEYVQDKYRNESNKHLLLKYSAKKIELEEAEEANRLDLKYSSGYVTNYVYDSEQEVYKQFVNDKEHKDYETGLQYTVKNIITYQVPNHSIDSYGRQDIDNIGEGTGYFITGGKAVEITWSKKSRTAQTKYKFKNGEEITVNDGNTWIHIVPTSGEISIS